MTSLFSCNKYLNICICHALFWLKSRIWGFYFCGINTYGCPFEIIPKATEMVVDITGVRKISYLLTLPMPTWATFSAIATGWAISLFILMILMVPMGKLFLLSKLNLMAISYWRLIILLITISLFLVFCTMVIRINEKRKICFVDMDKSS